MARPPFVAALRCRRSACTVAALLAATVLLAAPAPAAAQAPAQQPLPPPPQPFPYDAYDRKSMAGAAKGRKAGGRPDPVPGLANPDTPALSNKSASMEGGCQGPRGRVWRQARRLAATGHAAAGCGVWTRGRGQPTPRPPPPDLVLPYGYPLESYPVETHDGFVLRLYRIPRGRKNATAPGPRPAVMLNHGVTLASSSYAVLDPDSSMAFYLADAGGWRGVGGCRGGAGTAGGVVGGEGG
jgi:hypothetical protein